MLPLGHPEEAMVSYLKDLKYKRNFLLTKESLSLPFSLKAFLLHITSQDVHDIKNTLSLNLGKYV